jgi:nucleoporin POM152
MQSPPGHLFRHRRTKKDEFDLDEEDDETELQSSQQMVMVEDDSSPLHALLRGDSVTQVQRASLSSIRPEDSLSIIPKKLDGPQSILFLPISKPGIVTLNRVVDSEGLDFQIARGKEAVVIECPSGGHFTRESAKHGKQSQALDKIKIPPSMEIRCVGDRDVAEFEVRGVGALKVSWRKTSKSRGHQTEQGVIEGIEETIDDLDGGAINPTDPSMQVAALDKLHRPGRSVLSRTHVVAFPVQHDVPGIFTVSLQSVTDSMHNTHHPTEPASSKTYQVYPKSGVMFGQACTTGKPLQLLANRTINLPISALPSNEQNTLSSVFPIDVILSFEPVAGHGSAWTKTITATSPDTMYQVSEEGTYRILQVTGKACPGAVMEPSSCSVQMVPLPKVDFDVTTLHEW